jgi:predicted kinase
MIIMLCGIPGSGKSTISEILAENLAALGSVEIVSSDRLKSPVYRKIFRMLDQQRADFVILDATFHKKEWREQVRALARNKRVVTISLDCPLSVARARNKKRRPNISDTAVHIIHSRMEPAESPDIKLDTSTVSASDAAQKIFEYVKQKV